MKQSDVDETLIQLYLRMNGYFTSGFIVHSPEWGRATTEVDCLAVRHPHYSEPEREIRPSNFIGMPGGEVDLILCEVKSDPKMIGFNSALTSNPSALAAIIRWSGLFPEEKLSTVVERLMPLLNSDIEEGQAQSGIIECGVRVRALACCPSAGVQDCSGWRLAGDEIVGFLDRCFNPIEKRDSCSTRYNFKQWGYLFEPVVRYFKNSKSEEGVSSPTINGLYNALGVHA